jgi:hypothetical protein
MEVDKRHVVKLQGKDFITYDGLLDMAHQMGLVSIETELIDKDPYIFKAVAKTETQMFTGHGDADESNVNKMIVRHKIRMAETRAKARALRDLTNVGMCSVEEMGGDDATKYDHGSIAVDPDAIDTDGLIENDGGCSVCGKAMTDGQMTLSMKKHGKLLCPDCQKQ